MAEIIAKFNTNDKSLTVTIDGKTVADVSEVFLGRSYSEDAEYGCSVLTATKDETNDCYMMTRLVANESAEGKKSVHVGVDSKDFPGFLKLGGKSKAQIDIEAAFSK